MHPKPRHGARRLALQAIYQWQLSGQDVEMIETQFRKDKYFKDVDKNYFIEILHGVIKESDKLDAFFKPHIDRKIEDINPIELALLRMGTYELERRTDVPYRVVINESIELAKLFGAEEGHKFINGVLDHVAQDLRATEISKKK